MKLISVNVAQPKPVIYHNKAVTTGIFKERVAGRVMVRTMNVDGDAQADLRVHGGIHKAVYAYSLENYGYWQEALERDDFTYGQFGENFTVADMPDDQVHIGDVFQVGEAVVEVTQPRVPCFKLGIKMDDPLFPKQFLAAKRPGFYLRVLQEGHVGAGDAFERIQIGPEQMTVKDIFHLLYFDKHNLQEAERALCIPALSPGWQASFATRITKAQAKL